MSNPYSAPSSEEKTWALTAHLVPLAAMWFSAGFLGFVAGIVVYILSKDKGSLARNFAAQALNIQITAFIYFLICLPLCLVLIGFILIPIVWIWATVLHIIALLKAGEGVMWKPPMTFRFVS